MHCAIPDDFGIYLHTHSTGKLFNLARLQAKRKVCHVLICELLYPDDAAFVTCSEEDLQQLCTSFASACKEFGMWISLKNTVVLAQPATLQPSVSIHLQSLTLTASMQSLTCVLERYPQRLENCTSLSGTIRISHCTSKFMYTMHVCLAPASMQVRHGRHTIGMNICLNTFHFCCLWSRLSVCWNNFVSNSAMLERTGSSDLYTILCQLHLPWTGHVYRMNDAPQNFTQWWAS